MKKKLYACASLLALALGVFGFSFAQTNNAVQTNRLAAQLPASDAVVTMDMQRLMNTALPQILSADPKTLGDINAEIDKLKSQTGIDLRQFEQLAVGLTYKQTAPKTFDFEPVFLARGSYKADAYLGVAKVASKGKYREEKVGGKTIYVFSLKDIVPNNKPKTNTAPRRNPLDKMFEKLYGELAVTTFDDNTLAFGTLARVRELIAGTSHVGQDVLSLASRRPNTVMSFGANVPAGMSQIFNMDGNDEIGKNLDAIHQAYGSMDVADGNATVSFAAITLQPEQAQSLEEMLSGFQMIGKGYLSGMKGADKQVYARMAENARISRNNNEVTIDVKVPQSDINVLLGKK